MADTVQVGLIGTAGRGQGLTQDLFRRMKSLAICALEELGYNPQEVVLVSGGSAWADHVAVQLFLEQKVSGLRLKLPGQLLELEDGFKFRSIATSTRSRDCASLTSHHIKFSKTMEINSLNQIKQAIDQGAIVEEFDGFFARNAAIASSCQALIALHDIRQHPKKQKNGGTSWTFKRASVPKIYIPIKDVRTKDLDLAKFGFSDLEKVSVENVYKRFKNCFKGPLDAFLKRPEEDTPDQAPPAKRHKGL